MTLHWWMHWFWVTAFRLAVIMGAPSSLTTPDYTTDDLYSSIHRTGVIAEVTETTPSVNSFATTADTEKLPASYYSQNYRMAKAIGSDPPAVLSKTFEEPAGSVKAINVSSSGTKREENSATLESNDPGYATSFVNNGSLPTIPKKDSKITWIVTGKKNLTVEKTALGDSGIAGINPEEERDDLAVLPLQETAPTTRFKLVLNRTKFIPSVKLSEKVSEKSSEQLELAEEEEEEGEDIAPATAASVLQEASESPRLSRARSAFAGEYQQDQEKPAQERQQIRLSEISGNGTSSAVDIAAVTGSCLASVVLLGTMGSLGFVMYRRRYLNPPQTLNSDKCSNPDSSGYIDDSTIRDNSEEMYSLDNDSFLNSLEAMTIQNYWTDSVKHTKL